MLKNTEAAKGTKMTTIGSTFWVMDALTAAGWDSIQRKPVDNRDEVTATRGKASVKVNITAAGIVTFLVTPVGGFADVRRTTGIDAFLKAVLPDFGYLPK